jgi:O-methyltransferase
MIALGRRVLRAMGLLYPALRIKRRFIPAESSFRTPSPHLLIAIERALLALRASGVRGDYLEFGVFRGFSLWFAQQSADAIGVAPMRFFGFDSFQGLPSVNHARDIESGFVAGEFEGLLGEVRHNLRRYGADLSRVRLVPGWYDRTLTPELREREQLRACALAVIDCDLYVSARDALAFLAPLIVNGTIVLFDEWNNNDRRDDLGERAAYGEFLAAHPELRSEPFCDCGEDGAGFILYRS